MNKILLICILALAIFFRFWNLGNVPPSASMDEASIGYNAYSVLKIGVDEFGQFPIVSQRGYDDYRRSTYLFLTIPFIDLFGLTTTSVRLPAAILSVLTVWVTYHVVLMLFSKKSALSKHIALFTSFLLAISPWHIYISRLGHESNACLSFLIFGMFFFLKGIKVKKWYLILISGVFFTLSMISYYSGQAFIPLLVSGFIFIYRKDLFPIFTLSKKILIISFVFLVLLIPVFWTIFSPQAMIRFQGTSTFKPEAHKELFDQRVKLRNEAVANSNIIGSIVYNRRLFPLQVFIEGYLTHFRIDWLFTNYHSERFKIPNIGLLYLWEFPFIIIGIIILLFSHNIDAKVKKTVFLWFLLAPLPAAIATQAPHAMRSYNFLPTWQILSALGLVYAINNFKKFRIIALFAFFIIAISGLLSLYQNYFFVFPKEQSSSFDYALSKTIPFVLKNENSYNKIIFSNKDNLYQSYMLFLFYSKYDPSIYQRQGGTKSGGYAEAHKFGKYEFRPLGKNEESKSLIVSNMNEDTKDSREIKIFKNMDGKDAIKITEK